MIGLALAMRADSDVIGSTTDVQSGKMSQFKGFFLVVRAGRPIPVRNRNSHVNAVHNSRPLVQGVQSILMPDGGGRPTAAA